MLTSEKIDHLSDDEALQVLNFAVSGIAARDRDLAKYKYVAEIWTEVTTELGRTVQALKDEDVGGKSQQAQAARLVLREWLESDELASHVEAALSHERKVLVEPVTAALVLAAIVVVLQTRVGLSVQRKDGKTSVKFDLEKKATADGIVKKFFSFFV